MSNAFGPDLSVFQLSRLVKEAKRRTSELRSTVLGIEESNARIAAGIADLSYDRQRVKWMSHEAPFQKREEDAAWAEAACVFLWVLLTNVGPSIVVRPNDLRDDLGRPITRPKGPPL